MTSRNKYFIPLLLLPFTAASASEMPIWVGTIRSDHPRIYFNKDTFPAIRARALGPEKVWYEQKKKEIEEIEEELNIKETPQS